MRRRIKAVAVSLAALVLVSCQALIERGAEKQLDRTKVALLQDGKMHVVLVGSGGPMHNESRVTTSTAILAGGEFILVDTGPGTVRKADLLGLPLAGLTGVFLTHYHSDHIGDLGEANFQSWVAGRSKALEVYGPEGLDKVVDGFNLAYEADVRYRVAHHGENVIPSAASRLVARTFPLPSPESAQLLLNRNGLRVYAFAVDHFPVVPAVGYRFEYKGRVVVVTGDTRKTNTLTRQAGSADLLVSDALSARMATLAEGVLTRHHRAREAKIMKDIQEYHMTPIQAAEVARDAGAKRLVLTHITPPITSFIMRRMFLEGTREVFGGEILLGEDGMTFELDPRQ